MQPMVPLTETGGDASDALASTIFEALCRYHPRLPLQHPTTALDFINQTLENIKTPLMGHFLRMDRKSNAPKLISRLPKEVFGEIILGALDECSLLERYKRSVELCRVSRLWKERVYGAPMLWATIDSNMPLSLVTTALERSGGYPLTVVCHSPANLRELQDDSRGASFINLAAPHIPRWKRAYLGIWDAVRLQAYLGTPAPLLEEISVEGSGTTGGIVIDLFEGQLPSLRTVRVTKLLWQLDSPSIMSLTSLELRALRVDDAMVEILERTIQNNVQLDTLKLSLFYLAQHINSSPAVGGRILLPKLRILHLEHLPIAVGFRVFGSIDAPNVEHVAWLYDLKQSDDGTLVLRDGTFTGAFPTYNNPLTTWNVPFITSPYSVTVTLWDSHTSFQLQGVHGDWTRRVDVQLGKSFEAVIHWFGSIFDAELLALPRRTEIVIKQSWIDRGTLQALQRLPRVYNLTVRVLDHLESTLTPCLATRQAKEDGRPAPMIFPYLRQFHLELPRPTTHRQLEALMKIFTHRLNIRGARNRIEIETPARLRDIVIPACDPETEGLLLRLKALLAPTVLHTTEAALFCIGDEEQSDNEGAKDLGHDSKTVYEDGPDDQEEVEEEEETAPTK